MADGLTHARIWTGARQPSQRVGWLKAIWRALALSAVNYFAWPFTAYVVQPSVATAGFNVGRLVIMLWAGYLAVRGAGSRLWGAALAGMAVMMVDHIFLKGGLFLVQQLRGERFGQFGENAYLMAFFGVLVSFVMFCPLAGLAGALGGMVGRRLVANKAA